jgi:hypothetical protein
MVVTYILYIDTGNAKIAPYQLLNILPLVSTDFCIILYTCIFQQSNFASSCIYVYFSTETLSRQDICIQFWPSIGCHCLCQSLYTCLELTLESTTAASFRSLTHSRLSVIIPCNFQLC